MNKTVLFRFTHRSRSAPHPGEPMSVEWLGADTDPQSGTLADLAHHARGYRLILAAPAETIILTRAKVPGRQRATVLRALPYALEDSLTEDVETLHFAIGNAAADGTVPAAVVRRSLLEAWLDACNSADLLLSAIVPEPLLLPFEAEGWSMLVESERILVRNNLFEGFAAEPENVGLLLELALARADEEAPRQLRVWGAPLPATGTLTLEILREDTNFHPLQILAAGLQQGIPINLLQGAYGHRARLDKWLRPWRTTAALVGLWLVVQVVAQAGEYWKLNQQKADLQMEMARIYKEAVPGARRIVNPRAQLETQLRDLGQGPDRGKAHFFDLLHLGGQVLDDFEGVTLRGLRYKNAQLDLDLEGDSLEVLDRLRQRFAEKSNLQVQMRTAKREDKVQSQVTLSQAMP